MLLTGFKYPKGETIHLIIQKYKIQKIQNPANIGPKQAHRWGHYQRTLKYLILNYKRFFKIEETKNVIQGCHMIPTLWIT